MIRDSNNGIEIASFSLRSAKWQRYMTQDLMRIPFHRTAPERRKWILILQLSRTSTASHSPFTHIYVSKDLLNILCSFIQSLYFILSGFLLVSAHYRLVLEYMASWPVEMAQPQKRRKRSHYTILSRKIKKIGVKPELRDAEELK